MNRDTWFALSFGEDSKLFIHKNPDIVYALLSSRLGKKLDKSILEHDSIYAYEILLDSQEDYNEAICIAHEHCSEIKEY